MATAYVALLRGINVGGRNRILMTDLRACFESAGYEDVRTYIQSGNVLFRAGDDDRARLRGALEALLADAFAYRATVALRDADEMRSVVEQAPVGFGAEPDVYRYDVLYLLPPLAPEALLGALTLREGVDSAWTGPGVVYASRLIERAAQSGLSRIASHRFYPQITIRNWNTTVRLHSMMELP
jgi:uncharacterized protein (DUF1697 family)